MKKTISTLVAVLLTAVCLAQVPQKFNYQAIARTSTGEFIKEQVVRIQFSVLDGGATGTEVYKEEHTVNTDANGLISAQVGGGTVQSGDFSKIDWSKGNMWLQTNLDAGSGFELLGTQELLSVPYAIQAKSASKLLFTDEQGNEFELSYEKNSELFTSLTGPKIAPVVSNVVLQSAVNSYDSKVYNITYLNDNKNAEEVIVYYSTDGQNFNEASIADFTSTSVSIESRSVEMGDSEKVYFKMAISNNIGNSPLSNVVSLNVLNTVQHEVTNIGIVNNVLSWQSTNTDVYAIEVYQDNMLITTHSISDGGVGKWTFTSDVVYKVRELSATHNGPFSEFSFASPLSLQNVQGRIEGGNLIITYTNPNTGPTGARITTFKGLEGDKDLGSNFSNQNEQGDITVYTIGYGLTSCTNDCVGTLEIGVVGLNAVDGLSPVTMINVQYKYLPPPSE